MRILVTDGDTRAALAVTRSLGRRGHTVYVSAERRCSLAAISRFCAGELPQAPPASSDRELAGSIAVAARDQRVDRVFAIVDRTLTALHRRRPDLGPARMPPPGRDLYVKASDKVWLFEACRRHGIPVPAGEVVEGGAVPEAATLEALGGEVVVRPAVSWRFDDGRWIQGKVRVVRGVDALRAAVARDGALAFPYLIQRRLRGEGCGLFLLAREGRLLEVFSHRRLREKPPWGGVSTLCVSVAPPADLLEAASELVARMGWSGLAMLEFKRDRTGKAHLLEINARPWGSMQLAHASGVDFASDLIELAHAPNANGHALPRYREGVRMRWWWGDVDHFYIGSKHERNGSPGSWWRSFARVLTTGPWPESWDTFQVDDPLPFVRETASWLTS